MLAVLLRIMGLHIHVVMELLVRDHASVDRWGVVSCYGCLERRGYRAIISIVIDWLVCVLHSADGWVWIFSTASHPPFHRISRTYRDDTTAVGHAELLVYNNYALSVAVRWI